MSTSRTIIIFSDIEMGAGGVIDDFPHSSFLAELIEEYCHGRYADRPVDIVFNGDTFDFLKMPVDGKYPSHVTADVALQKVENLAAVHPAFFEAIELFLSNEAQHRRVHFIVGNHDPELLFPRVKARIRELCGSHRGINFPGFETTIGPVHIEHGHQFDPLFSMDPLRPFITTDVEPLLNLSWASFGLLQVVIPMHPELAFYDRMMPRDRVMQLVPELKDLFNALAWRYWTKDFWQTYLVKKDPVLNFRWTMLKEVIRRVVLTNAEVELDTTWLEETLKRRSARLYITGHTHRLSQHWHHGKRVLVNGCLRDEYRILSGGAELEPMLKTWFEVDLDRDERITGLSIREKLGPDRPAGEVPETIFDLLPAVRTKLADLGDTSDYAAAQRAQEKREEHD